MKNKYMENEHLSLALFFLVFIMYAAVYMTKNCYSAAMVYLVDEKVLTKSQTGTINSVFYLVYAPFQILGGMAADKHSPYKIIAIGLLGAAISNLLILFVQNYYLILAIWVFNGAIQFGIWPGVFKIVSQCLNPAHRKNSIFYILFASPCGLIMSYIVAGSVSGWRANFVVSASVLAVVFAVWLILGKLLDKKMEEGDGSHHGIAHLPEVKKYDNKPTDNFFITVVKSGLIIMLPVVAMQSMFSFGVQAVVPTMIKESYDSISPSLASLLAIIPVMAGVVGRFFIRIIYKNKIYNECLTIMCIVSVMLLFALPLLLIGKISALLIIVFMSLVVMLSSTSSTVNTPYVSMRFIKMGRNATSSGLMNACASLGIVLANFISPRIADNYGWTAVTISWVIFAASIIVLSFAAYFPWKRFIKKIGEQ